MDGTDATEFPTGEADPAIVAALRAIVASGQPLPAERALADRLAVKRHRLRGALEALRRSGEIGPTRAGRRGRAMVQERADDLVSLTNPVEVTEMRLLLEPGLARLAAVRASPVEVARVLRAATTPRDEGPGWEGAGRADLAFHFAVAAAARNALAAGIYERLRRIGRDVRVAFGGSGQTCPNALRQRDAEHRAVAQAIAARDPDAAEAAMRAHMLAVQRRVMERLSPGLTAA